MAVHDTGTTGEPPVVAPTTTCRLRCNAIPLHGPEEALAMSLGRAQTYRHPDRLLLTR